MDRDEIIGILTSEAAGRISFSFSTDTTPLITVNSTTFTRVADLLRTGRISLVNLNDDASADERLRARYWSPTDTLSHRRGFDHRFNRGVIIHEAVHASFDATCSVFSYVDNETAARVAQAIYLRRMGLATERWGDHTLPALGAANAIISGDSATTEQIERVRSAILASPHYGATLRSVCECRDRENMLLVNVGADGIGGVCIR